MRDERDSVPLEVDASPITTVRRRELPETVQSLIDTYDDLVGDRDRFLWQWLSHLFPAIELSCVDDDRARDVREAKLVATIFAVVADDVAERHGDRATFDELTAIPFDRRRVDPERSAVDGDIRRFLADVWDRFSSSYDAGPRAAEFDELLEFDLRQSLQAIEYSYLANQYPGLVSERELWRYDAHNMLIFVYADIDLAHAPSFDATELSVLRRVCDRTQRMARIGNWISTWKRELAEGDCSSGVVVRAVETDVVPADRIRAIRAEPTDERVAPVVEAIDDAGVEDYFLDRWRTEYETAKRFTSEIESVDIGAYLEGFETVLQYHVASEGLK